MTPDQLSKGSIFAAGRRAFTRFVLDEAHRSAENRLAMTGTTVRESMLKVEVLERVSSLTRAEADLAALLRPDLTEADFGEALARWMLYLAGGDVNVDIALAKVLEAVAPLIEQDVALRIAAALEAQASPDRLPYPITINLIDGLHFEQADQVRELLHAALRDTFFQASTIACEVAWNQRAASDEVAETSALHHAAAKRAMALDPVTGTVCEQLARMLQAALPGVDPKHIGEVLLTLAPMLQGLSYRASRHPDGMTAEKMAETIHDVVSQGGGILYAHQPSKETSG